MQQEPLKRPKLASASAISFSETMALGMMIALFRLLFLVYIYIDEYIYTYNTHTKYTSKELMIPDWVQEKIEKS